MNFNQAITDVIKHTFIFAFLVGIWSVLIEMSEHKLSGFFYGALPLGFIYLLFVDNMTRKNRIDLSHQTWIGGVFFLIFTFITYWLLNNTNLNILLILFVATLIFSLSVYFYNYYTSHLDITNEKEWTKLITSI
jgi:hypothetical protein